jgi:DNA-binding YbaB/EbfC family protein
MRELKAQADAMQKQLATIVVEADAGHGAVKVTVNGAQKVLSVKIDPKSMDPNKPEKLEELVVKAINEGISKAQKTAAKQMMASGNFKLPGMG